MSAVRLSARSQAAAGSCGDVIRAADPDRMMTITVLGAVGWGGTPPLVNQARLNSFQVNRDPWSFQDWRRALRGAVWLLNCPRRVRASSSVMLEEWDFAPTSSAALTKSPMGTCTDPKRARATSYTLSFFMVDLVVERWRRAGCLPM